MDPSKTLSARPENSTTVRATNLSLEVLRNAVRLGARVAPFATGGFLVDRFTHTNRAVQRSRDLTELYVMAERFELAHAGRVLRGHTVHPEGAHPAYDGDGPRILLVHGWDGGSHQLAPFVRPLVERGYTVTTFDLPGHGASDGDSTNLRDMADAIRRVAEHFGPIEALVAHSVGAAATSLALMEGLAVGRVVFVAPPTSLEGAARTFARRVGADEAAVRPMLATLRGIVARPIDEDAWLRDVERIRTPLLVFHDRDDRVTSHAGSASLVAHWPDARLVTTEGLGHARILADAGVVREAVEFLTHDRLARDDASTAAAFVA